MTLTIRRCYSHFHFRNSHVNRLLYQLKVKSLTASGDTQSRILSGSTEAAGRWNINLQDDLALSQPSHQRQGVGPPADGHLVVLLELCVPVRNDRYSPHRSCSHASVFRDVRTTVVLADFRASLCVAVHRCGKAEEGTTL
eukprot:scaffold159642_cov33-Tisochrysis_lutea.AAC.3